MAKKKKLAGQVFYKLTVVSECLKKKSPRAMWNCVCECGEIVVVPTNHLTTGNTKSCGCFKIETTRKNQIKSLKTITKYKPHIASARRLWKSYHYQDPKCNITFDDWFNLSQKKCFYCGISPSTTYNCFLKKENSSQQAKNDGYFTYNGIDRIDNSKPHIIDNVITSCQICNRAKNDRSLHDFEKYIKNLKINDSYSDHKILELPIGYLLVSVKGAFRNYKRNYGIIEINLQEFYYYSQQPCFYCGAEKTNYFNVYLKDKKASQNAKNGADFYYNGIDRLDNNKGHVKTNMVPCCYYCNFTKSNLSLLEFYNWINRIQEFQKQKELSKLSSLL